MQESLAQSLLDQSQLKNSTCSYNSHRERANEKQFSKISLRQGSADSSRRLPPQGPPSLPKDELEAALMAANKPSAMETELDALQRKIMDLESKLNNKPTV